MSNNSLDGFYTRQYLLRVAVPSPRPSRAGPSRTDSGNGCVLRGKPSPVESNETARRKPSNATSSIPRLQSDSQGRFRRSRDGKNDKKQDNKTTTTGPPPRSNHKGVQQKDMIQEKKSRKVSWSQYETLGEKESKKGVKKVFQAPHIEESLIDQRERNAKTMQNADEANPYPNPFTYLAIRNGSEDVLNANDSDKILGFDEVLAAATSTSTPMPTSRSRRREPGEEIDFDSYLEDCSALLDELKLLVAKRGDENAPQYQSGGVGSPDLDLRMSAIVQVLARKYVARLEEEWGKRRESWLADRLILQDDTEKEWGRGYEYKTFKDAIQNFNIPLQVPFDLSIAVLYEGMGNPVLLDEEAPSPCCGGLGNGESESPCCGSTLKEDNEKLKKVDEPGGKEQKGGVGDRGPEIREKIPAEIQEGNVIPLDQVLNQILQKNNEASITGKQPEVIYVKPVNLAPAVQEADGIWEDLRKAENDPNSNGYVGWWEALYRGSK